MRPWVRAILKVVVMATTMCSGIIVAKYDVPVWDEGHEEGRDIKQNRQALNRAA